MSKKGWINKRQCGLADCNKPHEALGFCGKHYYRYKKFGVTKIEDSREMHGMYGTPEYNTWASIVQRTTDKNWYRYKDWGGRGITMCDSWRNSFLAFYKDMGARPKGMSINRVDNEGNYEPGNCEWASKEQQARNKRVQSRNISGRTGVAWHKGKKKWTAYIRIDGRLKSLGTFIERTEAIEARIKAEHIFDR